MDYQCSEGNAVVRYGTDGSVTCFTNATTETPPMNAPFNWTPIFHIGIGIALILGAIIILNLWLGPIYRVWVAHKEGEADLAKAKNEQQIQLAYAQNRLAAAEANKAAAIVEAEAVSAQITAIGDKVRDHPLYLTWQWIKMMEERKGTTIYVPTEANLPILEAGRLIGDSK